ncbi:MAG: MYXO-CTERM sorting domain-containing protein [bacterium]
MRRFFALLVLAVSMTGCWLPPGDFTTPEYWAAYFLDIYADDLEIGALEEGPAPPLEEPRTVLLITGVTIPARWFGPIAARLRRDGFNPVIYEPPALLSYDLEEATADLAEVVERVHAESGQDRIDILAECTGGVIARHYIQSQGGEAHVDRMVTFVSPQHGVDKAPWAEAIAGWPALRDLTPGSPFLRAVNDAPLPDTTDLTSIYTCADEYIRPVETAVIPGATNIELCDRPIGHFETFFDRDVYLIMRQALVRPLINPPPRVERPAEDPVEEPGEEPGEDPVEEPGDPAAGPAQPADDDNPLDEPAVEVPPLVDEAEPEPPMVEGELGAPAAGDVDPAGGLHVRVDADDAGAGGCRAQPGGPAGVPAALGLLALVAVRRRRAVIHS